MFGLNKMDYSNYASLTTIRDKSVYSSNFQLIYILGLINTDQVFFASLNSDTGDLEKGFYSIASLSSASIIEITVNGRVYIMIYQGGQHYIIVYNQESDQFETTFDNVSAFEGNSIALIGDMFVVGGLNTNVD